MIDWFIIVSAVIVGTAISTLTQYTAAIYIEERRMKKSFALYMTELYAKREQSEGE